MTDNKSVNQGALFEEDYLLRSLGELSYRPEVALTELVANAWDAGASKVTITIPDKRNEKLTIVDDGTGMTDTEFHQRWMKLGYNREKHQGSKVVFPSGQSGNRLAYGRNGVGRHGLLCFANEYDIYTISDGTEWQFRISTQDTNQPFFIKNESDKEKRGHGTTLEVEVTRNLPDPDKILMVLSSRFLHDPQFKVIVNGNTVKLEKHEGLVNKEKIEVPEHNVSMDVLVIDTEKAARSTKYQGIAFWQSSRLVGEPSWVLGSNSVLDGRTKIAKRYTVVIKTSDLADYVKEDWTGFKRHEVMDVVYSSIFKHVLSVFSDLAQTQIDETKSTIKQEFQNNYNELSPLARLEVDEAIEHVIRKHPMSTPETLSIAVEAVINLEKTRSGQSLLQKLSQFTEEDVTGLNKLLDQWAIKDALSVLDEIDRRICVIEAIDKLSDDSKVDELQVLHPLVTEARWLFGPEYDSPEYTSNRQLKTVAKKIFKIDGENVRFANEKKRPDIVILGDSTVSITGAEAVSQETELIEMRHILIIELKRGGSNLTRENRNQAMGYVEDLLGTAELTGTPSIVAYVVGDTVASEVAGKVKVKDTGYVYVTTFAQMVDTAKRRLFGLKEKLSERYEEVNGVELAEKASGEQLKLHVTC